jgi:hypothetical protein
MNMMTNPKSEPAYFRDLCTKQGAEHLARCIVYFWEARGFQVEAQVIQVVGGESSHVGAVYGVRTKGIPLTWTPQEPGALKGRNWV